jgi:UDP-glucose 4-epimerase
MKKEKCIIYGGAGFIGSHITDDLLRNKFDVTVFDKVNASTRNIEHVLDRIEYIEGDFNNAVDLRKSLKGKDYVIHLVSSTLPAGSNLNPYYDVETNLVSSINLLEECSRQSIKKIIFISSGGTIYGEPEKLPVPETHPTSPLTSYGIIKLTIEKYFELYRKLKNLDYIILRFANPFGERQNPKLGQGLICTFLHKIKYNQPLEIWGDGFVIRDYFYIKDGVKAVNLALRCNSKVKIFNIGSGKGLSVIQILEKFSKVLKLKFQSVYTNTRLFDVKSNVLDISRAKKILKWKPETNFDLALKKTWRYILDNE